ncbi:MAG: hypothetical protein IV107_23970 [Paucibacter sp.]|nr:hypothetical protein [Roseateles sp.]
MMNNDIDIPAPVTWSPRRVTAVTEAELSLRNDEKRCTGEPCLGGQAPCPLAGACQVPLIEPAPTRARGLAMAFTYFRIWSLRYRIRSNELYLAECKRAGIPMGKNLTMVREQAAEFRAQLAELEAKTW